MNFEFEKKTAKKTINGINGIFIYITDFIQKKPKLVGRFFSDRLNKFSKNEHKNQQKFYGIQTIFQHLEFQFLLFSNRKFFKTLMEHF